MRRSSNTITLQTGVLGTVVCWSIGRNVGHAPVPIPDGLADPGATLRAAVEVVVQALAQNKTARSQRTVMAAPWRLVVAGGFYALASRPKGRWSVELATAAASELESVCPAPFDELTTGAIPVSETKAWACGYPTAVMDAWVAAAHNLGLCLSGFWSPAGALVDALLEHMPSAATIPWYWQDGRVRVELARTLTADPVSIASTSSGSQSAEFEKIRVFACRDAPAVSEGFVAGLLPANSPLASIPCAFLPAAVAHLLRETDPSESMNLLRAAASGPTVISSGRRGLAVALAWCTAAFAIWTCTNLVAAYQATHQAALAQSRLAQAWHQSQGSTPLPALPVSILEAQARAWQAVGSSEGLGTTARPVIALWAALAQALPPDVSLNISSLRYRQTDLWVDGRVPSQDQVRRLEAAWSKLPGLAADPFRVTGGGAGSTVNFSVRMAVQ